MLKIAKTDEDRAVLELQNEALRQVAARAGPGGAAGLADTEGDDLVRIECCRTGAFHSPHWLADGDMLVDTQPHDESLLDFWARPWPS